MQRSRLRKSHRKQGGGIHLQNIILAAVGSLVVALISLGAKKWYFDAQFSLRVEVRAFSTKTSEGLKTIARDSLDADQQYFAPMRSLVKSVGYTEVTITNISRKKITNVSATSPNLVLIWQVDDADKAVELQRGQPIVVGDIQPKHSRVIHIWCLADMSDFDFGPLKQFIRISADEPDSVRFRYPIPNYLLTKYLPRIMSAIYILVPALLFWALYTGYIKD